MKIPEFGVTTLGKRLVKVSTRMGCSYESRGVTGADATTRYKPDADYATQPGTRSLATAGTYTES
jgi:hypothetical protein